MTEALYAALVPVLPECIETAARVNEVWLAGARAREAKDKADAEKALQAQFEAAERARNKEASYAERWVRLAAKKAPRKPDRKTDRRVCDLAGVDRPIKQPPTSRSRRCSMQCPLLWLEA